MRALSRSPAGSSSAAAPGARPGEGGRQETREAKARLLSGGSGRLRGRGRAVRVGGGGGAAAAAGRAASPAHAHTRPWPSAARAAAAGEAPGTRAPTDSDRETRSGSRRFAERIRQLLHCDLGLPLRGLAGKVWAASVPPSRPRGTCSLHSPALRRCPGVPYPARRGGRRLCGRLNIPLVLGCPTGP